MTGSAAVAAITQRQGENLLLVFSYLLCAGCFAAFGCPCSNRRCCSLSIMHLSTLRSTLENRLLDHQLEQCIEHQSYRLIAYCLYHHAMYIQGPGCQKCFPVMPPTATTFPPSEDPNPRHCHHAPVPPSTSKCHTNVTTQNRCLSAK